MQLPNFQDFFGLHKPNCASGGHRGICWDKNHPDGQPAEQRKLFRIDERSHSPVGRCFNIDIFTLFAHLSRMASTAI